jgi:hypothetical protein
MLIRKHRDGSAHAKAQSGTCGSSTKPDDCPGDVKRPIHNRELNSSKVKPNNDAMSNNNVKSNNNDSL